MIYDPPTNHLWQSMVRWWVTRIAPVPGTVCHPAPLSTRARWAPQHFSSGRHRTRTMADLKLGTKATNGPKQSEPSELYQTQRNPSLHIKLHHGCHGAVVLIYRLYKETNRNFRYWVVRVGCGQAANTGEPFCIFNLEVRVAEYSVS